MTSLNEPERCACCKPACARLRAGVLLLLGLAVAGQAAPLNAQIGAIAAAPAVAGGQDAAAGAPLLMEHAFLLPQGQVALTALSGATVGSVAVPTLGGVVTVDFTYQQLLVGVYYALTDRFNIGVAAAPYLAFSLEAQGTTVEEHGRGDVLIGGKYSLWEAPDGATRVASYGSVLLPLGQTGWGREGTLLGLGLTAGRRLERVTLHAAVGVDVPTDQDDGDTAINLAGAGVYAASPRVALSMELFGVAAGGESQVTVAPGVRLQLGSSVALSLAAMFNAHTSLPQKPYDAAALLGFSLVR
jgi:hypothetical protein